MYPFEVLPDGKILKYRASWPEDQKADARKLILANKAGVKQRQFYRQLIAQADALYDAHLARLKKRKKEER